MDEGSLDFSAQAPAPVTRTDRQMEGRNSNPANQTMTLSRLHLDLHVMQSVHLQAVL